MKQKMHSARKIHFVSLGCARNLVDTEVMLGIVLREGYEITPHAEEADYLIVNTCGFLKAAREESCETIRSHFAVRKKGAKVIVAGCMVQKHRDVLKKEFPDIHYFLGAGDVEHVLDALRSLEEGEAVSASARSYLERGEVPRHLSTPSHYAYLKIAEGCAKQCAFCIIPKIKGPLRSKSQEQVLQEFDALLAKGVKEIILIAQDLGDYGKERGEKGGLVCLLRAMLTRPGGFWLRLLYLYPDEITPDLVEVMASDERICAYVDIPLQHVNDTLLKAMRRHTSKAQIIEVLRLLREKIPSIVIRSSLIVGFPGETQEQFEELVSFIKDHPIDQLGIFTYSREEDSLAAKMEGHLPDEVKQARRRRLAQVQKRCVQKRNRAYVGRILEVVVEGYHPDSPHLMRGRFYGQCPELDGQVIINDGRLVRAFGERYLVEITDVMEWDLIGAVIDPKTEKNKKLALV